MVAQVVVEAVPIEDIHGVAVARPAPDGTGNEGGKNFQFSEVATLTQAHNGSCSRVLGIEENAGDLLQGNHTEALSEAHDLKFSSGEAVAELKRGSTTNRHFSPIEPGFGGTITDQVAVSIGNDTSWREQTC
jgi:hypothetical protein